MGCAALTLPFRTFAILNVLHGGRSAPLLADRLLDLGHRHRAGGPLRHARIEAQGHDKQATHEERERGHDGLQRVLVVYTTKYHVPKSGVNAQST